MTAVWLCLLTWRCQTRLQAGSRKLGRIATTLVPVLAATLVESVVVVVRSVDRGDALPVVPAIAGFGFSFVLRHVVLDRLGSAKKRGDGS